MKINGLIDKPRWYDIPCKCNHDSVETEYPIAECLHCKFQECEDSLPRDDFIIKENANIKINKNSINRSLFIKL